MKLNKLTNNFFNWEEHLDLILNLIQGDSSDSQQILEYCKIVEDAFFKETYIALCENTYILEYCDNCETKPLKAFSQVLPIKNSCDTTVEVEVEFVAGYETLPISIIYDLALAVKGLYSGCCDFSLVSCFGKYINPLGYKNECSFNKKSLFCNC